MSHSFALGCRTHKSCKTDWTCSTHKSCMTNWKSQTVFLMSHDSMATHKFDILDRPAMLQKVFLTSRGEGSNLGLCTIRLGKTVWQQHHS